MDHVYQSVRRGTGSSRRGQSYFMIDASMGRVTIEGRRLAARRGTMVGGRRCALSVVLLLAVPSCGSAAPPSAAPAGASPTPEAPPLPSWADGAPRSAILALVEAVTTSGSPDFLEPRDRIAVFDNDGTLWVEQPMYPQLAFAFDRVRALARDHPEWRTTEPFASVLRGDLAAVAASGAGGALEIMASTHGGMSAEAFAAAVRGWIETARHPRFDRPYTALVYQPQLELIDHLHGHGFKVFIVSGGGAAFLRVWAEDVYGIPPERVVGSRMKSVYRLEDGEPEIHRLPEVDFVNDGPGKPVGIYQHVGGQPVLAFGNSDGDLEMLDYTLRGGGGDGPRLGLVLHHTDGERELAYDRNAAVGKLDRGLDERDARGLTLVDMRRDWRRVFPFETAEGGQ